MIDWLAETGAGLLSAIGQLAILVAALVATARTAEWIWPETTDPCRPRRDPPWYGLLGFFLTYWIILGLLFYPATEVLRAYSCKSAENYADCVDPPSD